MANAEEMILHAMATGVIVIMAGREQPVPPKVRAGLENALGFLEANVDRVLAPLPPERLLSFCEAALYALVTHLPFRKMNVRGPAPPSIASTLPKARSRSRRTVGSCIPACDFRLFCGRDRHLRTVAVHAFPVR